MQIVRYPDPILRLGGKPVERFDAELARTARAMFDVMYELRGVGLAAPQVGLALRLLVLNPTGERKSADQELVLVNPRIEQRRDPEFGEEGCLSFPGIYAEVERAREAVVAWQDLDGREHRETLSGFLARIVQHETDHLDGVLFVDRLSPIDKLRVRPHLQELERRFKARV
jgi:peptide deformylase